MFFLFLKHASTYEKGIYQDLCLRINYGDAIIVGEHSRSSAAMTGLFPAAACRRKFLQTGVLVLKKRNGSDRRVEGLNRDTPRKMGYDGLLGRGGYPKEACSSMQMQKLRPFIGWRPGKSDARNFCAADAIFAQGVLFLHQRLGWYNGYL